MIRFIRFISSRINLESHLGYNRHRHYHLLQQIMSPAENRNNKLLRPRVYCCLLLRLQRVVYPSNTRISHPKNWVFQLKCYNGCLKERFFFIPMMMLFFFSFHQLTSYVIEWCGVYVQQQQLQLICLLLVKTTTTLRFIDSLIRGSSN